MAGLRKFTAVFWLAVKARKLTFCATKCIWRTKIRLEINAYFCVVLHVTRLFTQRRSVAKSDGCFQRRRPMFVCLFVCQHDNFRTSKRNMMKLGE